MKKHFFACADTKKIVSSTMEKFELIDKIRGVMDAGPFCTQEEICEGIRRQGKYKPHPPNISRALKGDRYYEYLLSPIAEYVLGGEWECEKHKTWRRI